MKTTTTNHKQAIKNKVERKFVARVYHSLRDMVNPTNIKVFDKHQIEYLNQLSKLDYYKLATKIRYIAKQVLDYMPKQSFVGKLRYKLERLPLSCKDIYDYEATLLNISGHFVEQLIIDKIFQTEVRTNVNEMGEIRSTSYILANPMLKYKEALGFVRDPNIINIKGTTRGVKINSTMKKFLSRYSRSLNNIDIKSRNANIITIYYGLLFHKHSISNPKSKEGVMSLENRLTRYLYDYRVIQANSWFYKYTNEIWLDSRNRMYFSLTKSGLNFHGDKFESLNFRTKKEYILEEEDFRRLKSHAVQLLGDKKLSQQEAEKLYNPKMIKELQEPLLKFYKDIVVYNNNFYNKWYPKFAEQGKTLDKLSLIGIKEFCIENNIDHKTIIKKYGKWLYMAELSRELEKSVGDKSDFLLKEDTTNMGILLSGINFKERKMLEMTNVLKGKGINDTHEKMRQFINKETGKNFTRDDIKSLVSNPLNHGGSIASASKKLGISEKLLKQTIIKTFGISFLNFNIISKWGMANYPKDKFFTWKLPDKFVARSVAYSPNQQINLKVIKPSVNGYAKYKLLKITQDLPIKRIGSEYLNMSDTKHIRSMGLYANLDHSYEAYIVRKIVRFFIRTGRTIITTHDAFSCRPKDLFLLEKLFKRYIIKELNREKSFYEETLEYLAEQVGVEPPVLFKTHDIVSSKDIADTIRCIIP